MGEREKTEKRGRQIRKEGAPSTPERPESKSGPSGGALAPVTSSTADGRSAANNSWAKEAIISILQCSGWVQP